MDMGKTCPPKLPCKQWQPGTLVFPHISCDLKVNTLPFWGSMETYYYSRCLDRSHLNPTNVDSTCKAQQWIIGRLRITNSAVEKGACGQLIQAHSRWTASLPNAQEGERMPNAYQICSWVSDAISLWYKGTDILWLNADFPSFFTFWVCA